MSKQVQFDTGFWRHPDIAPLTTVQKLVYIYLITCPDRTVSGIFPISPINIAHDTFIPLEQVTLGLTHLEAKEKIYWDDKNNIVFLKNGLRRNTGSRRDLIARSIHKDMVVETVLWDQWHEIYGGQLSELEEYQPGMTTAPTRKRGDPEIDALLKQVSNDWNSFVCDDDAGSIIPQINSINTQRRVQIIKRIKDDKMPYKKVFEKIRNSDFLTGRKPSEKNPDWKATFDWIFKNNTNWQKVLEGNYDNKNGVGAKQSSKFKKGAIFEVKQWNMLPADFVAKFETKSYTGKGNGDIDVELVEIIG